MTYQNFPKNIAILGAAGKMGSGITLLTVQEITRINLENLDNQRKLFALDISEDALLGLKKYITHQIRRKCEKEFDKISKLYGNKKFDSFEVLYDKYLEDILNTIHFTTEINKLRNIDLIFEAVLEKPELKTRLINQIKENSEKLPAVFSNTSSIPIKEIEDSTGLRGRVVGFHFYNPPAVQKLVELITTASSEDEIVNFAKEFAGNIGKIIVPSNDVPGFIGNGHFMREIIYAFNKVTSLLEKNSFCEAVYAVNYISQMLLIRPMGIFQLTDYVGLDVCINILKVMNDRIENENIHSEVLEELFKRGVTGGQNSDGSQKDGIFKYEKGSIVGVFNPDEMNYSSLEELQINVKNFLGKLEFEIPPWKDIIKDKERQSILDNYFSTLRNSNEVGARLAMEYMEQSKTIAENIVKARVTDNPENVNKVLMLGFYHAYGPINKYC